MTSYPATYPTLEATFHQQSQGSASRHRRVEMGECVIDTDFTIIGHEMNIVKAEGGRQISVNVNVRYLLVDVS